MGQYSGKHPYNNWLFGYLGIGSFFTQPQMEIILPSCFCIFVIITSTFIRVFMICFFHLRLSLDINCDKFKWLYVDVSSGFWRWLDIDCCWGRNLSFYLGSWFFRVSNGIQRLRSLSVLCRYVFSNAFLNSLYGRMHSHIGYICLTFPVCFQISP